jgi:hypothetical protein
MSARFWLPSGKSVLGNYLIISDKHMSGRQVFNIVRDTSKTFLPHLFRETVASDIVKQDNSIIAAFKVQKRLDLEDMRTGFSYLQRFAKDIPDEEYRKILKEIRPSIWKTYPPKNSRA